MQDTKLTLAVGVLNTFNHTFSGLYLKEVSNGVQQKICSMQEGRLTVYQSLAEAVSAGSGRWPELLKIEHHDLLMGVRACFSCRLASGAVLSSSGLQEGIQMKMQNILQITYAQWYHKMC